MRDEWLELDDAALLSQCDVDTYRAGGPGGQKRNKTSSAVRLRHRPSGLLVIAEESRSQHENKARALRRLRMALALEVRAPVDGTRMGRDRLASHLSAAGRLEVSPRNPLYPLIVGCVLDELAAQAGSIREAAARLGMSTGQLARFIGGDAKVLAAANGIRRNAGVGPLSARS